VQATNGRARTLILDVTNEQHVRDALATLQASGLPLAALVNNAGVTSRAPVETESLEDARCARALLCPVLLVLPCPPAACEMTRTRAGSHALACVCVCMSGRRVRPCLRLCPYALPHLVASPPPPAPPLPPANPIPVCLRGCLRPSAVESHPHCPSPPCP
jgi:hypothetical protein